MHYMAPPDNYICVTLKGVSAGLLTQPSSNTRLIPVMAARACCLCTNTKHMPSDESSGKDETGGIKQWELKQHLSGLHCTMIKRMSSSVVYMKGIG